MNNYNDLVDSLNLDIRRNNKISFILGSATTMSADGKGVPGVEEINEIMKDFMISYDIYDGFIRDKNEMNTVETYQKSFEYLLRIGDQEMVKEVLAIIMGKAKPNDNEWYISKCINDLTKLICETEINVGVILTTNFDEAAAVKDVGTLSHFLCCIFQRCFRLIRIQHHHFDTLPLATVF
ncbi:hypothetical protein RBA71_13780 [Brenneria goodwinii]|uniref:hypothetical protein n=1 Tax=Brenneria goodwinii TaxID=1109412 RepID=UPI0036E25485